MQPSTSKSQQGPRSKAHTTRCPANSKTQAQIRTHPPPEPPSRARLPPSPRLPTKPPPTSTSTTATATATTSASYHCALRTPRRPLIPASPSLHTKLLLTRLLPPELVLPILALAALHRRTVFTRARRPIAYRERQVSTPDRIYQCVPPTLHALTHPRAVRGPGENPLRRVRVYVRFCPAKLPNAQVRFEVRVCRPPRDLDKDGDMGKDREMEESRDRDKKLLISPQILPSIPPPPRTPLLPTPISMDGKLQSHTVTLDERADVVRLARPGDRLGVYVIGDGGLYGDWLHIPGFRTRVLVEVREVEIECFCAW